MLYGLIAIVLFIAILMLFLIIMILRSQTDRHLDLLDKISNNNSSLQERILVKLKIAIGNLLKLMCNLIR